MPRPIHINMAERNLHPGLSVQETLEATGVSVEALAGEAGVSIEEVQGVLDGSIAITEPLAAAIERLTGAPAVMFMNLQRMYDNDLEDLQK